MPNREHTVDDSLNYLEQRVAVLEARFKWDEELRKQNPALQDLYEKYQVAYMLVKKEDDNINGNGGGG